MIELAPQALTQAAFAPFGEVIELQNAEQFPINNGLTTRFHDLCVIDTADHNGRPSVSIFRTTPLPLPHRIQTLERHPHGSQAFLPTDEIPFLVLVAVDAAAITATDLSLFITNGQQGINLRKNTWHHFQITLKKQRDFIVIDRAGPGANLEVTQLHGEAWIPAVA